MIHINIHSDVLKSAYLLTGVIYTDDTDDH